MQTRESASSAPERRQEEAAEQVATLYRKELNEPAPTSTRTLGREIRERLGGSVAAILFYGSCLRRHTDEGVLDFIVIVDDYRNAYGGAWLTLLNRVLPPNVFYLESTESKQTLRAKYSVVSLRELLGVSGGRIGTSFFWARLCQPMRAVYLRDAAIEASVVEAAVRSATKMVRTMLPLLSASGAESPISPGELWQLAFSESYRAEWRFESPETIAEIYRYSHELYDAVTHAALELQPLRLHRRRARLGWRLERGWNRALTLARLLKTAATFENWVPYVLWKLERHSGLHVDPSPRQLRHPFIFGWPVLYQVIRQRSRHSGRAR